MGKKQTAFLGIDIGGTKITCCVANSSGSILQSEKIATSNWPNASSGLEKIARLLEELLKKSRLSLREIVSIGISCPGPLSVKEGKLFSLPNLRGWEGVKITRFFQEKFQKKVSINNDGNGAVLAEKFFGSHRGEKNLVYLTCSTGMGGGAIVDGKLVQGVSDSAMEIGHFVLDPSGPLCACGHKGCFEAYCGGISIAKRMQKELKKNPISTQVLTIAGGKIENISAKHLIEALKKNDPFAKAVWDEYILRLAQGIATILMVLNPKALLLGTMAIHAGEKLFNPLKKHLPLFAWKENIASCAIEPSALGDFRSELSAIAIALENEGLRD